MAKRKYYVVWRGRKRGIFDTWEECSAQVHGYAGAEYRAFADRGDAEAAFAGHAASERDSEDLSRPQEGYAVDAACSGNPGSLEYRGIDLASGAELFHAGPFPHGTNNIGEFLAIVHALSLIHRRGDTLPVYCDSQVAILWVKNKRCQTKLPSRTETKPLLNLVSRAEAWLASHDYANPLRKWRTEIWGEIPADFGRK